MFWSRERFASWFKFTDSIRARTETLSPARNCYYVCIKLIFKNIIRLYVFHYYLNLFNIIHVRKDININKRSIARCVLLINFIVNFLFIDIFPYFNLIQRFLNTYISFNHKFRICAWIIESDMISVFKNYNSKFS